MESGFRLIKESVAGLSRFSSIDKDIDKTLKDTENKLKFF